MWKAIVTDDKMRNEVLRKIDLIIDVVKKEVDANENQGLLSGNSGVAIFLAHAQCVKGLEQEKYLVETLEKTITKVFESVNGGYNDTTYSIGVAGILWTFLHLNQNQYIEFDEDFDDIANWLKISLKHSSKAAYFDFLHGAGGTFKTLMKHSVHLHDSSFYAEFLEGLKQHGIKGKDTIYWSSYLYLSNDPILASNMGLAHGITGTILILSELSHHFPHDSELLDVLNHSINYVRSVRYKPEDRMKSFYPNYVFQDNSKDGDRLAWCYGDLCIAICFLRSGMILKRQELINEAIAIARNAAERRNLEEVKIYDAGICHGSSGVAHIFNRLYHYTGVLEFKNAALYWLSVLLDHGKFADGYAGYKRFIPEEGYSNSIGVLEGISGIGLVLISMIEDSDPNWDEMLLLSSRSLDQNLG